MPSRFSAAAWSAIASTPLIGRVSPVSASSPTTANEPGRSNETCPLPSKSPSAIDRSNPPASFFRSAGARLITTRSIGRRYPELTIARSTRCVLSLTAVSARPTSTVLGTDENETSTSTSTGIASMPTNVYDASFASMAYPSRSMSTESLRPIRRAAPPRCRVLRLRVKSSLPWPALGFIPRPRFSALTSCPKSLNGRRTSSSAAKFESALQQYDDAFLHRA